MMIDGGGRAFPHRVVLAAWLAIGVPGVLAAQGVQPIAIELEMPHESSVFVVEADPAHRANGEPAPFQYLPSRLTLARDADDEPQLLFTTHDVEPEEVAAAESRTGRLEFGMLYAVFDWRLDEASREAADRALARRCGDAQPLDRFRDLLSEESRSDAPDPASHATALRVSGFASHAPDVPCDHLAGPAQLSLPDDTGEVRLYVGVGYGHPEARVSRGRAYLLPGQRIAVAIELDSIAASWLDGAYGPGRTSSYRTTRIAPPGAWWLELDLALPTSSGAGGHRFSASYDVRPWFESLRRRTILVGLEHLYGAESDSDFGSIVDAVVVMFAKDHANETTTSGSLVLTDKPEEPYVPGFTYDRRGNESPDTWLQYRYRTLWLFTDGGRYDTGWSDASDTSVLTVAFPYEARRIEFEIDVDEERPELAGADWVSIEVSYPFFASDRNHRKVVPRDQLDGSPVEIRVALPRGPGDPPPLNYRVTWHLPDKSAATTGTLTVDPYSSFIFVDESTVEVSR